MQSTSGLDVEHSDGLVYGDKIRFIGEFSGRDLRHQFNMIRSKTSIVPNPSDLTRLNLTCKMPATDQQTTDVARNQTNLDHIILRADDQIIRKELVGILVMTFGSRGSLSKSFKPIKLAGDSHLPQIDEMTCVTEKNVPRATYVLYEVPTTIHYFDCLG